MMAMWMEVAMSLRARVGRHTKNGGRHCQNWEVDQKTVIDLLNRTANVDGGAGGTLGGRVVSGICSDALYRAISRFEDKYWPGQRDGYLDPGGPMLKRMEQLATRPAGAPPGPQVIVESITAVPVSRLDMLRDDLLDESQYAEWPLTERVAIAALVKMAIQHVDNLKEMGHNKLPWSAELFGRAYVWTPGDGDFAYANYDGDIYFTNEKDNAKGQKRELPHMSYGRGIADRTLRVTTGKLTALLLFDAGFCFRFRPYYEGDVDQMEGLVKGKYAGLRQRPLPVTAAKDRLGVNDIPPPEPGSVVIEVKGNRSK
jgi:hypothetical protein